MKVTLLSNLFPPTVLGGAELSAYFTGLELVRRGIEVSVITIGTESGVSREEGMRIHRIKASPLYTPYLAKKKPKWIKPLWHMIDLYNPIMGKGIRAALAAEKPDVVHCHNLVGFSSAAWDAAGSLGIPIVQHLHDYHLACPRATLMNDRLESCPNPHFPCSYRADFHFRMLRKRVKHIISPSAFCVKKLFEYSKLDMDSFRVSIVPNGTDYADMIPRAAEWGSSPFKVLFIGGLFEHKGFPLFLEMVRRVNAAPNPFEFHIAGKGPLEAEALACQKANGNVHHHGFIGGDEKLGLFRESHLFVFPSIWLENNPVSITEALAIGLPVLGSDIGGVPELIRPVSPELLFAPGSADDLVGKLRALEQDRSRLESVSKALLRDRARYGIRAQVDRTVGVYVEAMESRAGIRPPGPMVAARGNE